MCHILSTPSPSGFPALLRKIPFLPVAAGLLTAVPALRAAPGDIDPSFNISIQGLLGNDCRIIPAGDQFYIYSRWGPSLYGPRSWWSHVPSDYLTRWNADGTRDTTFKASPIASEAPVFEDGYTNPKSPIRWHSGIRNTVGDVRVREDGSLLVTGYFGWRDDSSGGNGSGTFSFPVDHSGRGLPSVPASVENQGEATQCLPLRNGGFLLVGDFKARPSGGSTGHKLIRLKPDFSVDQEFVPPGFTWDIRLGRVFSELLDGGFLCQMSLLKVPVSLPVNGEFAYIPRIRRLHADGSLDASFANPSEFLCGGVFIHPDGMLLLSRYEGPGGLSDRLPLVRLGGDGKPDPGFKPPANFDLNSDPLMLQADGKFLSGGSTGGKRVDISVTNASPWESA
ncbi:MAG: hypothetical protein EOP86_25885, partial [Verrucomicrobiaceae bacterium]